VTEERIVAGVAAAKSILANETPAGSPEKVDAIQISPVTVLA
jgi:uncharacterized protein involved in high-affinity Fe2+ transport